MIHRIFLGAIALFSLSALPAAAQTCVPLSVVEGDGETVVDKVVSQPNLFFIRSNWNTDFIVPEDTAFTNYVATINSDASEETTFDVEMYLKYPDDTADETFDSPVVFEPGESERLTANPRLNEQPYQVNLEIGGLQAIGSPYTLSVRGCY